MDWKIFFSAFGAILLAELADKTQLVGIGLSAKSGKPFTVWLGAMAGFVIVTALSVFIGAALGKYLKADIIRYCGASVFIAIGILMFLGKV